MTYLRRCQWCGKSRGYLPMTTLGEEALVLLREHCSRGIVVPALGALICPQCDYAHDDVAGPECEDRVIDLAEYQGPM